MTKKFIILAATVLFNVTAMPQQQIAVKQSEKKLDTQWNGKRVGYLGDSITDSTAVRGITLYWRYLQELLGIEPLVYGINGHQMSQIYGQAEKLFNEQGENIDAIMIFAGTNDYNGNIPIGQMFEEKEIEVETGGPKIVRRLHRTPIMSDSTFCGRINKVLHFLKEKYPSKQIIILTPIHRGYAKFGDKNIQPDEYYCNNIGLFLESYVATLKEAAAYWSVPVIDLYSECGLLPNLESHSKLINKETTDRLHPSTAGHYRIAKTMQYRLLSIPSNFD